MSTGRGTRYTRSVALHPIRRATPVPSRNTRSEGVSCLRIGCTASRNKLNRGHFLPTHPSGSIRRSHTTSKYPPGSEQDALHPFRRATPVPSQCTRSVALHPFRCDTPDQKGCHAYGSGALPPTTSTTADSSSRHTQAAASDAATQPRNTRPAPNKTRYTRSVAPHPIRRDTPVPSRCTRSEGVSCLRIGCTAPHDKHT